MCLPLGSHMRSRAHTEIWWLPTRQEERFTGNQLCWQPNLSHPASQNCRKKCCCFWHFVLAAPAKAAEKIRAVGGCPRGSGVMKPQSSFALGSLGAPDSPQLSLRRGGPSSCSLWSEAPPAGKEPCVCLVGAERTRAGPAVSPRLPGRRLISFVALLAPSPSHRLIC